MRKTFPRMQIQIIDTILQRHNPAVEKVPRAHQLAAEVVDDKAAAQRLHVQRGFIKVARGVILQVKHLQGQLAAGGDERPAAGNPARIVLRGPDERIYLVVARTGRTDRDMDTGVVIADDLSLDGDRIGHVDYVVENAAQSMRN